MREVRKEWTAWRAIAETILERGSVPSGLCGELQAAFANPAVTCTCERCLERGQYPIQLSSEDLYDKMSDRLDAFVALHSAVEGIGYGYVYPAGTHHEERAMACLWMALEAQEEAKAGL